jgi:hypothetical protein
MRGARRAARRRCGQPGRPGPGRTAAPDRHPWLPPPDLRGFAAGAATQHAARVPGRTAVRRWRNVQDLERHATRQSGTRPDSWLGPAPRRAAMAVLQRHQNANDAAIATSERQRCGSWSRRASGSRLCGGARRWGMPRFRLVRRGREVGCGGPGGAAPALVRPGWTGPALRPAPCA